MTRGPAVAAFDAEIAAEEAGDPWGPDEHFKWRWLGSVRSPGESTAKASRAKQDQLRCECAAAPLAHPRLIRR